MLVARNKLKLHAGNTETMPVQLGSICCGGQTNSQHSPVLDPTLIHSLPNLQSLTTDDIVLQQK